MKKETNTKNQLNEILGVETKLAAEVKKAPTVQRYYLLMVYPEKNEAVVSIIDASDVLSVLEEMKKITSKKEHTHIAMLLNSHGGDIYSAYKIINIVREYCDYLTIVVPLYAKSAATLMTLGANQIIMGPQSELGPLDLPTEHPIAEGRMMSALDAVRPIEYLAATATELAYRLGLRIRQDIGLSRRDSIEIALQFASDYITPIMDKLDPLIVNECYRELDIAGRYAREFLANYMLVGKRNKEEMADSIAHQLVWGYPSHGFAIAINEAKRIGLEVCHCSEYSEWGRLWETFQVLNREVEGHIVLTSETDTDNVMREISGSSTSACKVMPPDIGRKDDKDEGN